jgi:hypothetical protein
MFRAAILGLMVWVPAVLSQTPPARAVIEWDTNSSSVRVVGPISPDLLRLDTEEFQRVFPITVEPAKLIGTIGLPAVVGTYNVRSNSIQFMPRYPFEPGVAYRATFVPTKTSSVLRLALPVLERTTLVSQVYPTADVLPQNLLKFYLHFSAPMRGGHIYEHIHLVDQDGGLVELPFLEIDEELWNRDMTRLTLFLDPGRIKRGVRPLEETGPALSPGRSYTLRIDADWRDARGAPLKEAFEKRFRVTDPDRDPPDPSSWRISGPPKGSRDPLVIDFREPMDHALALRMTEVKAVAGQKRLDDHEQRLSFVPNEPWKAGRHEIAVLSIIEDLAGNNIGKPFEVDLQDTKMAREPAREIILPFAVE